MKRTICLLGVILVTLLGVQGVFANVFAFDISVDTSLGVPQISYRLNEPATSVEIEVFGPLPATTVISTFSGTTGKGLNTVSWSGSGSVAGQTYGFKITATDSVGHSSYDVISDDSNPITHFYSPRGLAVNTNNGSPYWGMVYVVEPVGGTCSEGGATRVTGNGVYILYPDLSDPTGQGNTAHAGGVSWGGSNSPYHCSVGSDDSLWLADWSDSHSGLWRATPTCTGSFTEILDNTGRDGSGLVAGLHGSISAVSVEGTGASTVIYTMDEDLPTAISIWKYEIGNGPFPWTGAPTAFIDHAGVGSDLVNCGGGAIARDSSGKFYVSQYRYDGTDVGSLMVYGSDGKTVEWDSLTSGGVSPDPLRNNVGGATLDEARDRLFTCSSAVYGFVVTPLPLPVGNLDAQVTNVEWTGSSGKGIAVDGAGNVYIIDNANERLRIYSPPDEANSFTTETNLILTGGTYVLASDSRWALYE